MASTTHIYDKNVFHRYSKTTMDGIMYPRLSTELSGGIEKIRSVLSCYLEKWVKDLR